MNNFKKILAVVCVIALLCVGVVLTVMAEDGYTGTVEGFGEILSAIEAGGDKDARIKAAVDYLATVDPEAEGLGEKIDSLKKAIVEQANVHIANATNASEVDDKVTYINQAATLLGYLEIDAATEGYLDLRSTMDSQIISTVSDIADSIEFKQNIIDNPSRDEEKFNGYWNTMDVKIAINKINGLLKKGDNLLAAQSELKGKLKSIEATYQEKRTANMELAEAYATIEEYKYGMLLDLDFENAKAPNYGFDKIDNTKVNKYGIEKIDGNSVFTIHYIDTNTETSNTYPQVETLDAVYGIVCEFDFATFSEMPGSKGFDVSGGGQNNQAGKYCDPLIFGITSEGDLYYNGRPGRDGYTVVRENVITPGEWVHLAYVFNYSKQTFDIYFEYELVASGTAKTGSGDSHVAEDAAPIDHTHIRPNASAATGEFSLDNFKVYKGSAIRTDKKLANMDEDEKFIYYCDYIHDSRKYILSRNNAYTEAGKMLTKYCDFDDEGKFVGYKDDYSENSDILAAIEKYYLFDLSKAIQELREANRDEFIFLVNNFAEMERNLDTTALRMTSLKAINEFLESAGANIEQDELYNAAYKKFEALEKQLGCDINAISFALSMGRFATAPTLVARKKHLDNATALKYDEDYPLDMEYYNSCFKTTSDENGNEILTPIHSTYNDFIAEYSNYDNAHSILEEYQRNDIAKKIVNVIDLIKKYDTEEEWIKNYDYVNEYILILRGYVKDNEDDEAFEPFNEDYEGINEALEIYKTINTWFYNDLQGKHIEYLDEQLDMIAATDSYITKRGIVAYIEKYFATNDIDYKNEEIKRIVTTYETYQEELEYREKDYAELLVQNAYYFNSVVTKLSLADSYTEMKSLYDEATTYYFALDASVKGTRDMMAVYDAFTEKLTAIDKYSKKFIESMALYALVDESDKDEKFNALVTCFYYSQYAEEAYEGVAEKMIEFNRAYDAYMNEVAQTNSELSGAVGIMASSRANNGNAPVVSVFLGQVEEN